LFSKFRKETDIARIALDKKKLQMGVSKEFVMVNVDTEMFQQLVDNGDIKLNKKQVNELKQDLNNIKKLDEKANVIEKEWYDDHFITSNNDPNDSLGMSPEIAKIRDEYVAGIGNVEVMAATNRGLRRTGRVTSRVQRFDALIATGSVKEPVVLWRSAILSKEAIDSFQKGYSFVDKGFQSTGVVKGTAELYAEIRYGSSVFGDSQYQGVPVIFKMKVNKGVGAVDVGYGETVLQRNTKMNITNVSSGPKIQISENISFTGKAPAYVYVDVEVDKA
jgi:hypothetical protein